MQQNSSGSRDTWTGQFHEFCRCFSDTFYETIVLQECKSIVTLFILLVCYYYSIQCYLFDKGLFFLYMSNDMSSRCDFSVFSICNCLHGSCQTTELVTWFGVSVINVNGFLSVVSFSKQLFKHKIYLWNHDLDVFELAVMNHSV